MTTTEFYVRSRVHHFGKNDYQPNGVTETSREAYHSIYDTLGQRQQEVYDGFLGNGSCTNLELSHLMQIPINCVTPRTNELVKRGLIVKDIIRECNVTGNRAISWKVK